MKLPGNIWSSVSIKNKMITIIVSVAILIMAIGFSFEYSNDVRRSKQEMIRFAIIQSDMLASYCVGPISFGYNEDVVEILQTLESNPDILWAAVYDSKNQLFAYFSLNDTLKIPFEYNYSGKVQVGKNNIIVNSLVFKREKQIGKIVLNVSTMSMTEKLEKTKSTLIYLIIGLIFLAILVAEIMQKVITKPIRKLASITKKVAETADYNIRLQKLHNDETGRLYDHFNYMLEQIQKRETEKSEVQVNLVKAKEKAEESDRLKSAFLANMSHEIRTPLNAIVGFSNLLAESNLDSNQKQIYLEIIQNSNNSLLNLINDIIDISIMEAGELKINKEPCFINSILNELILFYEKSHKKSGVSKINFKFDLKPEYDQFHIYADPFRFRQIFTNLITNAIKFTESGEIEIGFLIETNQVLFFVRDTGIGIPDDKIKVIFERFRKEHESENKLFRGAGLGLAISKNLVETMGGKIWVESKPNQGSVFWFTIPSNQNEDIQELNYTTKIDHPSETNNWVQKSILIAEDEETNYYFLEEVLKKTNIQIHWAKDGLDAVDLVKRNKFDLILMDIKMPVLDGYEATKTIKSISKIPIIAQTAYAMTTEINRCYQSGCDDYISKPINSKELLEKMKRFLSES